MSSIVSSDHTSSQYRIQPLEGSANYSSWKIQLLDILTDADLDDHVDPDVKAPTDSAELKKWKKADRRTLSAIRLRVSPTIIQHIQGETTALGAWENLSHLFELKGKMGLVLARHKFYGTRAPAELPLEDHIMQMRQFQGELKSLGHEVDDADFAVALLGSLPADWDSFVQATLSSITAPDSKTVISLIHTEEARRSQRADSSTALVSRARRTATHYPKKVAITSAPSSSPVVASSGWKNANNAKCHKCGGKGHFARLCPSQQPDDEQDQAHPAYVDDDSDADSDRDFAF